MAANTENKPKPPAPSAGDTMPQASGKGIAPAGGAAGAPVAVPAGVVPAPAPQAAAEPVATPGPFAGLRMLVVDDSGSMRLRLGQVLVAAGAEVLEARDGRLALDILKHALAPGQAVDLVITDLTMPELDGEGLLAAIRQHPELRQLPVVVQTQERDRQRVVRCLKLGISGYLLKPCPEERILEVVRAALPQLAAAAAAPTTPPANPTDASPGPAGSGK